MSDFDAVLERLVTDPAFKSALAADPAAALGGYQLSADEVDLLRSQVSVGDGGDRTVELRTSKASMMGLLSPLAGLGMGGEVSGHDAGWIGPGDEAMSAHQGWIGPGDAGMSDVDGHYGTPADVAGMSDVDGHYGPAADLAGESVGHGGEGHYGAAAGPTDGSVLSAGDQIATDYHPHIDADGDGKWDEYVAVRHADGSVDVYEDRNHDGLVDFIGHDRDGDGILESADYDENFDGVADTHMADTNGDGWMDSRGPEPTGK